jgi:lipoprotein-releasing system permease protein
VYKILLCWRYLLTRYLAMVCIVSVMLGVGTLIVVNSVMNGFSTKLKDRLHGLLSDVVVETNNSYEGFASPEWYMAEVKKSPVGDKIECMTPAIEVFAMLQYNYNGAWINKPVHVIGVDPQGRTSVGGFAEFLVRQKDSPHPTFEPDAEALQRFRAQYPPLPPLGGVDNDPDHPAPAVWTPPELDAPPRGVIVGNAIAFFHYKNKNTGKFEDACTLAPGDRVTLLTVSTPLPANGGGQQIKPVKLDCIVTDYFKSEMSEYDSNFVFVPLDYLQELRGMNLYHENRVTSIQFKLKDYRDAKDVVEELQRIFPDPQFSVQTWEQKQGPLLAAIAIEKGILNLLLFMIIAVAGFGILAIFSMIVTEKTRDIGILKALGASNGGIMKIFLGYGLLLGVVGASLGTGLGLAFTIYINEIEKGLSMITGQEVFDRSVYYFDKIPTDIQPLGVALVNLGAIGIAVLFSVLPALRAALLHPVRALRYE